MAITTKLAQVLDGLVQNIDLTDDTLVIDILKLGGGAGTTLSKAQLDSLLANDHASGSDNQDIVAGAGLTGGGTGATATLDIGDANKGIQVNANDLEIDASEMAGTGLTENGVNSHVLDLADTAVTPAAYGDAQSVATFTVDQQGRLTAAGTTTIDDDTKIPLSQKGANSGVATLDGSGKLPTAQLPTSAMEYKGAHNVATNTPTLVDATGTNGDMYRVSVGGTRNYGSGNQTFAAGDAIIYNGAIWEKIPGEDIVQSVAGKTGVVTLDTDDVTEADNLYWTQGRFDTALTASDTDDLSEGATNKYHTTARARTAAVDDTAYAGSWDAVTDQAPSKNAVYDKLEALAASDIDYTPTTPGDWPDPDPTNMLEALDDLAEQVAALSTGASTVIKSMIAGESFADGVTIAVRMSISGETDGRVYKIDPTAANKSYPIGLVKPSGAKSASDTIQVTLLGEIDSSVDFTAAADEGKPVFVTTAGVLTLTAPATGAIVRMGMVQATGASSSKVMVQAPTQVAFA